MLICGSGALAARRVLCVAVGELTSAAECLSAIANSNKLTLANRRRAGAFVICFLASYKGKKRR